MGILIPKESLLYNCFLLIKNKPKTLILSEILNIHVSNVAINTNAHLHFRKDAKRTD